MILLFLASGFVADLPADRTILISQFIVFLPVFLLIYRGGYDWKRVARFQAPAKSAWPATILAILGGWILSLGVATIQNQWFPFPEQFLEKFLELFESLNNLPLPLAILLIAVLPALNEELFCRGIVMRSWIPRFGVAGGILFSALAFGLLHLDPYRFLGTTLLGILLGYIAYSTGSILPSMLAHATNNALSFLVQKYGESFLSESWLDANSTEILPWYWMLAGALLLLVGLRWLSAVARAQTMSRALTNPQIPTG
jgi:membrane protease YdiL (CAAX protease family)